MPLRSSLAITLLCLIPATGAAGDLQLLRGRVEAVRFSSDHGLIQRSNGNILDGGQPYRAAGWTRSPRHQVPITHTAGADVRIRAAVTVRVTGLHDDARCLLQGVSGEPALCFRGEGTISPGAEAVIDVEAVNGLGVTVRKLQQRLTWTLTLHPGTPRQMKLFLGATGPHVVYTTLGTPRHADEPFGTVTDQRMELVVRLVSAAQKAAGEEASSPRLVHELMKQCGADYLTRRHYGLERAWQVPETWTMKPPGVSCISIVEFVVLLCDMAGVEGKVKTTAFYARAEAPRTALRGGLGDVPVRKKGPNNETWQLFLVDENNTRLGQVGGLGGVNFYEAALEYEWRGRRYYYPGGTDVVWDRPETVLHVFRTLAWAAWDESVRNWVVREVVHTYVGEGERRPPSVKLP